MSGAVLRIHLPGPDATARLGAAIAAVLKPGDLITLTGDLGAGKTALARAIIRTLCANENLDVPSPSFALVQPYETAAGPVLHADLYRLANAREIDELGLSDDPEAIVLVEWAERASELAAAAALAIVIEPGVEENARIIAIGFTGDDRGLAERAATAGLDIH